MDLLRIGQLARTVRIRRGLRQVDVAAMAGVSHATVSLIERGHGRTLSLETLEKALAGLDIRLDVIGRWRGGDADRLISRSHSLLASAFAGFLAGFPAWIFEPEVSFAIYAERGCIDILAWHAATRHLLIIELKTQFVDVNDVLAVFDRKIRLATRVAMERGWNPMFVSAWMIASDTKTHRRHAAQHRAMLKAKLPQDGRQLRSFLERPSEPTRGLAFWTTANRGSTRVGPSAVQRVKRRPGAGEVGNPRSTELPRDRAAPRTNTGAPTKPAYRYPD